MPPKCACKKKKKFDGHFRAQVGVLGAVDLAHAALVADLFDDFVMGECFANHDASPNYAKGLFPMLRLEGVLGKWESKGPEENPNSLPYTESSKRIGAILPTILKADT